MRLWTTQPPEIYEQIQTSGVYRCDITKSDYHDLMDEGGSFGQAYRWMVEQMCSYLGPPPEGVQYPVWGWRVYNWKVKQPDLRTRGLGKPGTQEIMLEVEIPDDQVLLSDYNHWHSVLNDGPLFMSPVDVQEMDQAYNWYDQLSVAQKAIIKKASWQNIFVVNPYKHGDWNSNARYVQATFWELRKEQIINARAYKAR